LTKTKKLLKSFLDQQLQTLVSSFFLQETHISLTFFGEQEEDAFYRMKTRSTLKRGQRGTVKLTKRYGDQLLYVRYRYDPVRKKRLKTVELIIEETDWEPNEQWAPDQIVGIRVAMEETRLQKSLRKAGGIWNRRRKVWEIRYEKVLELQLESRIVDESEERSSGVRNVT